MLNTTTSTSIIPLLLENLLSFEENDNYTIGRHDTVRHQDEPFYTDAIVLFVITCIGLVGNIFLILSILLLKKRRKVTNMFLLHHCFISCIQTALCVPFILALLSHTYILKYCHFIGGAYYILVTASLINLGSMCATEAYKFEDLINDYQFVGDVEVNGADQRVQIQRRVSIVSTTKTTASCSCVLFGVIMIWLASVILHLGITLIASDSKQFYNFDVRNCFFIIGDRQTYILYIMWILITVASLVIILKYMKKIYVDVIKYKKINSNQRHHTFRQAHSDYEMHKRLMHQNSDESAASTETTRKVNYKALKKILQNIRIQFFVLILFMLCWSPLFVTLGIDIKFDVPILYYRILTIITCSNSCLTPYCYLIPNLVWCCFKCLKSSKPGMLPKRHKKFKCKETIDYYDKIGARFHMVHSMDSLNIEIKNVDNNNDFKISETTFTLLDLNLNSNL